jgi:CRISPR-associated protein Csd1
MILQSLVGHYEDLNRLGKISAPGWGKVNVSFGINLNENGEITDLFPLKVITKKGNKEKEIPRSYEVPQPVKRSVDVKSNFLCDNSSYIFGIDEKGKPERSILCFQNCKELHLELLEHVKTPAADALCKYFETWNPEQACNCQPLIDNWNELMSGANCLFFFEGSSVLEDKDIRQCWQEHYNSEDGEKNSVCLVTGQAASLERLHPIIKGVIGAQAMGTSLISFNAPAFCSYGKEQGENASIGKYAAFAYATALNELLDDRAHKKLIGDTTVVYWAEGGETAYQDIGGAALFGIDDGTTSVTNQDLDKIFSTLRKGEKIEINNQCLDSNTHFYILGLAPNAARLVIRFFYMDSFGNIMKKVAEHYDRLEIVKPVYDKWAALPLWKLLQETINDKSKDKTPSPQMAADTLRAVISGTKYPASLLNNVMIRIRAEREVTRGKAAIIKAYYLKNKNKDCPEEVLQVELNEQCTNIPYTLGRLFAVLEHLQQEANPGINTTIKDKYFNSAASTPGNIFPILINLAQKHLRKLSEGQKIYFDRQIGELSMVIGERYPIRLNLAQQGAFQLGYYCQTQKRYQKKEDK